MYCDWSRRRQSNDVHVRYTCINYPKLLRINEYNHHLPDRQTTVDWSRCRINSTQFIDRMFTSVCQHRPTAADRSPNAVSHFKFHLSISRYHVCCSITSIPIQNAGLMRHLVHSVDRLAFIQVWNDRFQPAMFLLANVDQNLSEFSGRYYKKAITV